MPRKKKQERDYIRVSDGEYSILKEMFHRAHLKDLEANKLSKQTKWRYR